MMGGYNLVLCFTVFTSSPKSKVSEELIEYFGRLCHARSNLVFYYCPYPLWEPFEDWIDLPMVAILFV